MGFFIIPLAEFLVSFLTFFTGFGLGTILMPAFLIFFPVGTAIALTAAVQFLNKMPKLSILRTAYN